MLWLIMIKVQQFVNFVGDAAVTMSHIKKNSRDPQVFFAFWVF